MITLGLEGTAHTLGVGVVDEKRILADRRATYQPRGGIHPREASRFIAEGMKKTLDAALDDAGITMGDIGLFTFSQGPGLGPCLRTVATAARALALHYRKPIMGVNHCIAHIEIGRLVCKKRNPLVLYVSGGNTQILRLREGRYRVYGETLDIGVGNMLDKFGRTVGLKHPAGPRIEEQAGKGDRLIELPYVVKGTDLSFSGILTNAEQKYRGGKYRLEDICYSLQETSFSMLAEVTERALAHLKADELLLVGGVGNNRRLQDMLSIMSRGHGCSFCVPEGYCSDNGVMIAYTGLLMYNSGVRMGMKDTVARQRYRTDEVDVLWH